MRFEDRALRFASGLVASSLFACSSGSRATSGTDGGCGVDAPSEQDAASRDGADGASPSRANGSLGDWQSLSPMPLPRANHCSVVAAGYLVVIGGNYEPEGGTTFVDIDEVDVAMLHEDGSIGAWSRAGSTPSPVSGCTAAARGDTIYIVDGLYDDASDQGHVFSARLSASGVLTAFSALGPLPGGQDAFYSEAWVTSEETGKLLTIDSSLSSTTVLEVSTVPTMGVWSIDTWLSGFLGRPESAFTGSYLYAMGGYLSDDAGNPTVTTVVGSPVAADGKIGASFKTQPLPAPITYGNGIAVDNFVFVVGGKTTPFGTGEVGAWSSEIASSGDLGAWKAETPLPQGRTDMALTLAGDFLYLTGGGYMGPGVDTVFAARVRF